MKVKRPYDCGSFDEVCELQTDHHELKNWWISVDGYEVSIYEQRSGETVHSSVSVPKRQFDALVQWYMRQQKVRTHGSHKEGRVKL